MTSHCDRGPDLDPNPAEARAERAQKGDDGGWLGGNFLLQDHPAGGIDNAHRGFLHWRISTAEMLHLIASSSRLEVIRPRSAHRSEGNARSSSKAEPQPPRWIIYRALTLTTPSAFLTNPISVFTRDGDAAQRFVAEIALGNLGVNVPMPAPVGYYSHGGWKASALGDLNPYGRIASASSRAPRS